MNPTEDRSGIDLPVLYRDDHLVAVHKPVGLLVHPSRIAAGEKRCAMKLLRDRLGRWVYPVHRLDRPTSGVLLFALTPDVARTLGEQFSGTRVVKTYLAVVRGWPAAEGIVDHPLKEIRDPAAGSRPGRPEPPRAAVTRYRTLTTTEVPYRVDRYSTSRYALVEVCPESGRRHQIRRHFKHLSHPVIGDTTYGKSGHNHLFQEMFGSERLLLVAVGLGFIHPDSGRPFHIVGPPESGFQRVVDALGWSRESRACRGSKSVAVELQKFAQPRSDT
ncbi:MAG: pseudouridine synthase [Pseudomonadota bacterium]|nr:pseudouridine synthase [Pseudomonadota bacterium]